MMLAMVGPLGRRSSHHRADRHSGGRLKHLDDASLL